MPSFQVVTDNSQLRPRLGIITTRHGAAHTPASVLPTSRGAIFYLTPDMFESQGGSSDGVKASRTTAKKMKTNTAMQCKLLQATGVKLTVPQLVYEDGLSNNKRPRACSELDVVNGGTAPGAAAPLAAHSDTTNKSTGWRGTGCGDARSTLGHYPFPVVIATVRGCLPTIADLENVKRRSTEKAMSISTPSGSSYVTPESYLNSIETLGPDLYASLAEEIPSSKNSMAASKERLIQQ